MRISRIGTGVGALAAVATMVVGAPVAHADGADGALTPHTTFTMDVHQDGTVATPTDGEAIPNIDSVKSTLRAYYGATKGTDPAHAFSTLAPATTYLPNLTDSPYAHNTEAVAQSILAALPSTAAPNSAVVFDVDSTLLSDYANEEDMAFNYNSTLNGVWVDNELFPAVAGMPQLVQTLAAEGYQIFGITGRPASQESATVGNLTQDGYTDSNGQPLFTADTLYTKDIANQPWVDCTLDGNSACSTVEYKALTRQHIEQTTGDDIVMNVGDQWSDLEGGNAEAWTKMPNPSYFLPSADIPGAPTSDAQMVLPTTYTMAPDGSTGATATDGDALPNEGPVVSEIRAYYNATNGIASKTSSPYITQLRSLESGYDASAAASCRTQSAAVTSATARLTAAEDKVTADRSALTSARNVVSRDEKAVATARAAVDKARKALARAHGAKAKRDAARTLATAQRHLATAKRALATAHAALAKATSTLAADLKKAGAITVPPKPAVVFDTDDTTLMTYDMEDGAMHFSYDPTLQDTWVQNEQFPATPGMPELVSDVADAGCTVFGLTGRTDSQKYATLGNLASVGYTGTAAFSPNRFFTKWNSGATPPAYIDCGTTCTTIQYKSQTRAHIESLGYRILGNFGDQYSDLIGGHSAHTYKLPNPTYYLP